ncbi:HCP-like protein [Hesseltinella vesiculosa]|uniref:HCP-like protein n=1 Tax=Hesseltinella vesiculosa TaxID=101127 RepID=A0A1X2GPG7_9FUNG|nr:HCP-like protein [Hesseltinella vesiculosa]
MTSLQQLLDGVSPELHSHKVLELIKSSDISSNPSLFYHAIQYLRIKAIKGDVDAKLKLSTLLDGDSIPINGLLWQPIVDHREADLWSKTVFDRRLATAIAPCLALVEADVLLSQTTPFRLMDKVLTFADQSTPPSPEGELTSDSKQLATVANMAYLVGLLSLKGIALPKDTDQAIRYFNKASSLDHDEATYQLAVMMDDAYNYPDMYDHQRSVTLFEQLVSRRGKRRSSNHMPAPPNANHQLEARAAVRLARAYFEGDQQGDHRDMDKAYRYARKVAEHSGEKYCQYIVGDILLQKNDVHQAVFWLTQAGQQGFPLAIETLARVHFEGVPPEFKKDHAAAHEWCIKGDEIWPSGIGYCQTVLGDCYRQGLGVPKDQLKSFEYYQKAASQQDSPQNYALFQLAEMFYHGDDNWIQNIPVAKDYYQAAAKGQYEPAKQRLQQIEQDERQQLELERMPKKQAKPWSLMSLFIGRRRVHA